MQNELMTNIAKEVVEEITDVNTVTKISNAYHNVFHGKLMIEANTKVALKKLEAQENVLRDQSKYDAMNKHDKAEIAKATLKAMESISRDGNLTETLAISMLNYAITFKNDL